MRAAVFAFGVLAGLAACRALPAREVIATPPAGMTIALYRADDQGYGVVDDRRWVDITDGTVTFPTFDATAPLASLVIEPLDTDALVIGACARDARTAIHCAVSGPRGRHLIRVLYVTSALRYVVHHDIAMHTDDEISIATRFEIPTPAWSQPAQVTLFDGLPGQALAPREVARE